jgi:phosphatidylserine decarboxylase
MHSAMTSRLIVAVIAFNPRTKFLFECSSARRQRNQCRAHRVFLPICNLRQQMAKPLPLPVWDRQHGKLVEEWMDDRQTTYESRPRRSIMQWLESQPLVDWLLAAKQQTRRSAREIAPFVRKYHIDMTEFEPMIYRSFAEFFDRKFRPGVRNFPADPGEMGAFAEARYMGWQTLDPEQTFPIKGHSLDAGHILGSEERAQPYIGGPLLIARLAPVDYHHLHYPDHGETLKDYRLGRRLWTVN